MGAPEEEGGEDNERPQHEVTLRSFLLCQTACTQEAWERIEVEHHSTFPGPQRPVEGVGWPPSGAEPSRRSRQLV